MKKTLSLILAVMMLLGCMSVTAFAEEPDNTTDITLTVAKALTYDMVIPEDVTNLNAAGIYSVGQAKVQNVKNATDKTVISYTAETTAFKCEGKTDIPASYYTDAQGATAFPTTAVEVYKSKADAASIPTMYVGISEAAWDAAENGTYHATVTFNFEAEEVVTIADILPDDFPTTQGLWASEPTVRYTVYKNSENLTFVDQGNSSTNYFNVPLTTPVAAVAGGYECSVGDASFTFNMTGNALTSIVAADTGKDVLNGTYTEGISATTLKNTYAAGVSSWKSETDKYIGWDYESFRIDGSVYAQYLLYKSGENQYKKIRNGVTFTFNIEDGTLKSIEVETTDTYYSQYVGTYYPVTVG